MFEKITATFQEGVISLLTECLFKTTRLSQVSIMVALRNILSKLCIIRKVSRSPEEERIFNRLMDHIERALHYSLGKWNVIFVYCTRCMIRNLTFATLNSNYKVPLYPNG